MYSGAQRWALFTRERQRRKQDRSGEIWVAARDRLCSVPLSIRRGVKMYLQETQMNGKPIGKSA